MALPQRQLAKLPPLSEGDGSTGRVIPWTPQIINPGTVQTGSTGNNADGTVAAPPQQKGKLIPFPMQGGRQGMVPQIQRPPNVPDGHKLMWVNPTLANDLQQHFSKTNATAVVPHGDVRVGNVANNDSVGRNEEGAFGNNPPQIPVPIGSIPTMGNTPITSPIANFPEPTFGSEYPGGVIPGDLTPAESQRIGGATPVGTDPNTGEDTNGNGRFGSGGTVPDPNAADRVGGSGGGIHGGFNPDYLLGGRYYDDGTAVFAGMTPGAQIPHNNFAREDPRTGAMIAGGGSADAWPTPKRLR